MGNDFPNIFRPGGNDAVDAGEQAEIEDTCRLPIRVSRRKPEDNGGIAFVAKPQVQHLIQDVRPIGNTVEGCLAGLAVHVHRKEIDKIVYETTTKMGGIPAPLNYEGFPYSVCTSVNDQVCHGYPSDDVILKSGDIVNVDCSTILDGYYSDSSRMFMIGDVDPETKKLVQVTKECCDLGLEQVKPWGFLGDVGAAICKHAHENGYQVVREIGGHGVGLEFHEEPWVGYNTLPGTELLLVPGFMFTIEPMVNMGTQKIKTDPNNGWEVSTLDGKPSAQWEYQVLVTETGYEVISY